MNQRPIINIIFNLIRMRDGDNNLLQFYPALLDALLSMVAQLEFHTVLYSLIVAASLVEW